MKKLLFLAVSLFVVGCFDTTSFAQNPVANNDTYPNVHGTQTLPTGANDFGDAIPTTNTLPSHGVVQTLPSPTRHIYTPTYGYTGPDSFQYQYCWTDQSGEHCSTATVTLEVVNQDPVTVTSTYNIHWFGFIGPWVTGPEGPDSDPDGDELAINNLQILTNPTKGFLTATTVGDYRFYVAIPGETGQDSFTYEICDGLGGCSVGTVNITVNDIAPVAVPDFFLLTGVSRHLGAEKNDFSLDGDPIDISADHVTGSTQHGDLLGRATSPEGEDGWNYVRFWQTEPNYVGTDGFNYKVREQNNGGGLLSNEARVTILIIARDDAEDAGATSCDGKNPSVNPSVARPINTTNGNMWLQERDFGLPAAVGENIDIVRTYNSILQNDGLFGLGWSSQYDESLQFYGDDKMLRLNMPDGKAVYFGRATSSDIFYSASPDVHGRIVQNQDNTYILTFKDGRSHKFDSGGTLLWQKDRNGNQTTLAYNTGGFLTTITDSFGRALTLSPASNGKVGTIVYNSQTIATYVYAAGTDNLESVTYQDGSKYQFTYDTIGGKTYLTTVKDALNNVLEAHTYDSQGRATTSEIDGGLESYTIDYFNESQTIVTDGLGNVSKYFFDTGRGKNVITKTEGVCGCGGGGSEITTYGYDSHMNLIRKTDALGKVTTYNYDGNGNLIEMTNHMIVGGFPDTITQKYTYNSFGDVLTYTDPLNGVTTNTYNTHGNLLTTTDPLNNTTTIAYLSNGMPLTVNNARNHTTEIEFNSQGLPEKILDAGENKTWFYYDTRGRPTSIENAKGETTSFEFDTRNRLKKVTYPDANFVSYNYDLAGRRTSMTDERGHATTYAYDDAYRLTGITDPLSHTMTYGYDAMSNLTSQTDALGNTTDYRYDDFNRLDRITYPAPTTSATRLYEEFIYNAVGNITQKIDTAGRTTSYHYDDLHRVDYVTDALNNTTYFTYDDRSQTTKVKDALNQEYTFTYDALGRVISQTRAGTTASYEYNEVGALKKRTDHNGQVTNYTYDVLDRLTNVAYTGSTNFATYGYDELSRLTSAQNQNGIVTMGYNNRGWVNTTTDVHGQTVEYTYDAAGNRTALELNNTSHTTYQYDNANRLTELSDEANQNFYFAYDNANRLLSKTLPNNLVTSYTYDGMSRLTRLKHENPVKETVLFDNQYGYNSANQISQVTDLTQTRDFSYDLVDRLTQVSVSQSTIESYAYDAVGNRSTYTHGPFNRTTAAGNTGFAYNNNGNRTTKSRPLGTPGPGTPVETTGYTWDEENRLVGLHTENTGNSDQTNASYEYDALGRRIRSTVNLAETEFTYDGQDVVKDSGFTYQNAPGIDNKLKSSDGNVYLYFAQDHLGSTLGLTDTEASLTDTTDYDSFGNATNSSFPSRYRFTGRESESATGLQYSRARWYDPLIGKFISEDPIGFAGGDINLYGYVRNRPLMSTDPEGLDDADIAWENQFKPNHQPNPWYDSHNESADNPALPVYGRSPEETERMIKCSEKYRFSSMVAGLAFDGNPYVQGGLELVEVGSFLSLASDGVAMSLKAAGPRTASSNPYASGINMMSKNASRGLGNPGLFKTLRPIGDKATPILAVTGAFTLSYNTTIDIQCACGFIE